MKTALKLFLFLLVTQSMSAQYGNGGYGGGYGNGGYGNNGYGHNGMGQMPQREPEKPKEIPAEVSATNIVKILKEKLQLDELQVIAIGNVITSSLKQQGVILKQEIGDQDKIDAVKALSETTDRKIMEFLNKDQKAKYKSMIDERSR